MIEALLAGFQASVLYMCVVAIMSLCGVVIAVNVRRQMRVVRRKLKGSSAVAMAAVAVVCTVMARKGTVTVDDPYIQNAGSYLTNDVAHASVRKRTNMLPDDTEILVYARQVDLTNATDWVRLEPHLTLAQTRGSTPFRTPRTTTCSWPRTSRPPRQSTRTACGRSRAS